MAARKSLKPRLNRTDTFFSRRPIELLQHFRHCHEHWPPFADLQWFVDPHPNQKNDEVSLDMGSHAFADHGHLVPHAIGRLIPSIKKLSTVV
jgi:hypothetical protein